MHVMGLDIGTTTISAVITDGNGTVLHSITENNNGRQNMAFRQDAGIILAQAKEIIRQMQQKFHVSRMGITGQMHSMLYTDQQAQAVSPLFTWQDQCAVQLYNQTLTYSDYIAQLTGYKTPSGYGMATHFYNMVNQLVPVSAAYLCTIGDYIAANLTGTIPVIHPSNAMGLGLFDIARGCFDSAALQTLGIDAAMLPRVVDDGFVGQMDGVEVSVAIGDNQASFLGSVGDSDTSLLVNLGTGGQISCVSKDLYVHPAFETRPYRKGQYLLVYSSLCGGRAYAILEQFFRQTLEVFGGHSDVDMYAIMAKRMENYTGEDPLHIDTAFAGKRENALLRGSISNIGIDNFTPDALIFGFCSGMLKEFMPAFHAFSEIIKLDRVVGSGNAVRRNCHMQMLVEQKFGLAFGMSPFAEEAAYGAALFAAQHCL